jgi:hypothetical protein
MAEWTPFQTHCYSENLIAPGIEPGTSGLAAMNSDHQITKVVSYIEQESGNQYIVFRGDRLSLKLYFVILTQRMSHWTTVQETKHGCYQRKPTQPLVIVL